MGSTCRSIFPDADSAKKQVIDWLLELDSQPGLDCERKLDCQLEVWQPEVWRRSEAVLVVLAETSSRAWSVLSFAEPFVSLKV